MNNLWPLFVLYQKGTYRACGSPIDLIYYKPRELSNLKNMILGFEEAQL